MQNFVNNVMQNVVKLHRNGLYQRHYYRPQTKLREGYVFTSVCDSVNGGVYPIMPWSHSTPPPPDQTPPLVVAVRAVRILLECILVNIKDEISFLAIT